MANPWSACQWSCDTHLSFILLMYISSDCRSSDSILGTSKRWVSDFS